LYFFAQTQALNSAAGFGKFSRQSLHPENLAAAGNKDKMIVIVGARRVDKMPPSFEREASWTLK